MPLDQVFIDRQQLFQLNHGQIIAPLKTILQRKIVFMDCLINTIQFTLVGLHNLHIIDRCIILFFHTAAYNPMV